jgi:hypothetical protein
LAFFKNNEELLLFSPNLMANPLIGPRKWGWTHMVLQHGFLKKRKEGSAGDCFLAFSLWGGRKTLNFSPQGGFGEDKVGQAARLRPEAQRAACGMGGGGQPEGCNTVSSALEYQGKARDTVLGGWITQWQPAIVLCTMTFMISGSLGALSHSLIRGSFAYCAIVHTMQHVRRRGQGAFSLACSMISRTSRGFWKPSSRYSRKEARPL